MQGHTLNLITIHCALGLWLLPSLARTYIGGGQALQVSDYLQQLLYIPTPCQYAGREFPHNQYRNIRDLHGLESKLRLVSDESESQEKSNTKQKS